MNYVQYFVKNWFFIASVSIIFAGAGFLFSMVQPQKYEASEKLLVIQKGQEPLDPYTASKSAENLSAILREVIYTNSFFKRVQNANFFLTDDFGKTDDKKLKNWEKTVKTETVKDTGILNVKVYHKDQAQAEQIAHAIAYVLVTNGEEYHGGGSNIVIRIIDGPRVSEKPVVPHVGQNTLLGFLFGITAGVLVLIARYESGKHGPLNLQGLTNAFRRAKMKDLSQLPQTPMPQMQVQQVDEMAANAEMQLPTTEEAQALEVAKKLKARLDTLQ